VSNHCLENGDFCCMLVSHSIDPLKECAQYVELLFDSGRIRTTLLLAVRCVGMNEDNWSPLTSGDVFEGDILSQVII
jgi:hypothetical protein